eukprot:TRINITY_DN7292_c0_g2_i1.p1 TRINITY_DN7292_c0_g2~~TRINITY_DN7292_c0_g2_i1.p1  ORF type:complete len:601 (-),score=87.50 TRINITY_DN7292_c0_g2_i1:675-2477(-)
MKRKKNGYYAVAAGIKPGIYETWEECSAQVNGFKGAKFKSFRSYDEAAQFIQSANGNPSFGHSSNVSFSPPNRSLKTEVPSSNSYRDTPPPLLPRQSSNYPRNSRTSENQGSESKLMQVLQPSIYRIDPSTPHLLRLPSQAPSIPAVTAPQKVAPTKAAGKTKLGSILQKEKSRDAAVRKQLSTVDTKGFKVSSMSMEKLREGVVQNAPKPSTYVPHKMLHTENYSEVLEGRPTAKLGAADNSWNLDFIPLEPTFERTVPLNEEQEKVRKYVLEGKNVFFTGAAGSGKSHLLRYLISELKYDLKKKVAVTASTGLAAIQIGGCTLHKFAGVGISMDFKTQVGSALKHSRKFWRETDVLVVDEISMLGADFFDSLNRVGQHIRACRKPFGGIQLVLVGDFLQLPPVPNKDPKKPNAHPETKFCFEAECWDSCVDVNFQLQQIFRQSDTDFVSLLNEVRMGKCSERTKAALDKCRQTKTTGAVILQSRNAEVDRINTEALAKLPGQKTSFLSLDQYHQTMTLRYTNPTQIAEVLKNILKDCLAIQEIELKVGAQVMLLRNLSKSLVNGSQGHVVGFKAIGKEEEAHMIEVSPGIIKKPTLCR